MCLLNRSLKDEVADVKQIRRALLSFNFLLCRLHESADDNFKLCPKTRNDFFAATTGAKRENVVVDNITLQILASANLVAFVGHNGLMDFKLENQPTKKDDENREAIILACASRNYFSAPLKKTSAKPLLWTSNLMAPEAYILHDALEGWIKGETDEQVRNRAATAYSKYQKISLKSARNLLVTG